MIDRCDDAGTKPVVRRMEVFTGAGRRRRWSDEDKAAIVAESYAGVGTVCEVARRHGLASGQLFTWRRALRAAVEAQRGAAAPAFVPVVVEPAPALAASPVVPPAAPKPKTARRRTERAAVELEIDGVSVRIARGTAPGMIAAVIDALKAPR